MLGKTLKKEGETFSSTAIYGTVSSLRLDKYDKSIFSRGVHFANDNPQKVTLREEHLALGRSQLAYGPCRCIRARTWSDYDMI